jgi:integrase
MYQKLKRNSKSKMVINEEGVDVFSVSQMMGHTTVKQTMKEYVHISESKVMRDMKEILGKTA